MKIKEIKKQLALLITLVVVSIALMSFTNKEAVNESVMFNREPMYYVAVAWEFGSNGKNEPVVSNVVYVKCDRHDSQGVELNFSDFYDAFYRKTRGTRGIEKELAFEFKTRDAAIQKRRELIADYNEKWNPLLVTDFTVTCDD